MCPTDAGNLGFPVLGILVPIEVSGKATTASSGCWNASELFGRINLTVLMSKGRLRFSIR